jgi:23S rRNA (guanosine2251-2'-O)-methyltransferase
VAVKASAGVAERIPVARAAKLPALIGTLVESGFRAVALDPSASDAWDSADLTGPVVVVAGGEGRGLRPGIVRRCTDRVAIPLGPGVESLNVSVAVAVVLFEVVRQRRSGKNLGRGS